MYTLKIQKTAYDYLEFEFEDYEKMMIFLHTALINSTEKVTFIIGYKGNEASKAGDE